MATLESAPIAMVMVNDAGIIELVNADAEDLFQYPREELVGRSVDMLLPGPYRTSHARVRKEYVAHPSERKMGVGRELFGLALSAEGLQRGGV